VADVGDGKWNSCFACAHTEWEEDGEARVRIIRREEWRGRKEKYMKKALSKRLTGKREKKLAALARMPDSEIDLTDIPEIRDWSGAVVGKFYRPIKKPVTIRVDADVLAWLKSTGKGYQTRINRLLREAMEERRRRSVQAGSPRRGGRA
jgi:uncharacterized protein (DUF4415 family)